LLELNTTTRFLIQANVRFVREVFLTRKGAKKDIRIFLALAITIFLVIPSVSAQTFNNVEESVPIAVDAESVEQVLTSPVPEEPTKAIEPVVVAEVVPHTPQPKPQPTVVIHPKGCENYRELYTAIFGDKADVFLKIANKESSCNPMAVGDKHLTYFQNGIKYGMSCGLLQVRYLPGRPNCSQMQDPEANARYALNLYNAGGFRHWTVCNKGLVNCY